MGAKGKLVRMTDELIDELVKNPKVVWGEPVEYVITDDNGKQYYEPVYSPSIYINDINEPTKKVLTSKV